MRQLMKKLIIIALALLIAIPLFAQKRAIRVDSIRVNDSNIITDDGTSLKIDPIANRIFTIYNAKSTSNILEIINDYNDDQTGDSIFVVGSTGLATAKGLRWTAENPAAGTDSCGYAWVDDGHGKIYIKASDADSLVLTCDADSARIRSNNPISVYGTTYFWDGISVSSITDRTEYVGESEAVKLLKKVNLTGVKEFANQDDVFVLPYELRDKQYRDLSRCVSFLLAIAKSQQAEIEKLKKKMR